MTRFIKKKDAWIASRDAKLQSAIVKMQEQLLSRLMVEIIPKLDTRGSKILNTLKNYQLLASLDKLYKEFNDVQRIAFVTQIGDTALGIAKLNKNFFTVSLGAALPDLFDDILKGAGAILDQRLGLKGGEIIAGSFLEELISNRALLLDVKQFMSQAVAAQVPTKTFIKGLNDLVVGTEEKPGGIDKQFKRYAHDVYMQYDSAYASQVAEKAKLNYFIYLGGKIKDSRDFCVAHDARVWSRKEAELWPQWTPEKGQYPEGYEIKQKNTSAVPSYLNYPGYAPLIDRGGYNCRHHLGWLSDELALDMRPELKK